MLSPSDGAATLQASDLIPLKQKGDNMNQTISLIQERRSIRTFRPEQIKEDELQAILSTAICAPTSVNQQKYHFTILQNKDVITKINNSIKDRMRKSHIEFLRNQAAQPNYAPLHHAPTVIFVTSAADAEYPTIDCALATENMVIAAQSLGIASCVTTSSFFLFDSEAGKEVRKDLGIPEDDIYVIALALGYPADPLELPPRERRTDVFHYVR